MPVPVRNYIFDDVINFIAPTAGADRLPWRAALRGADCARGEKKTRVIRSYQLDDFFFSSFELGSGDKGPLWLFFLKRNTTCFTFIDRMTTSA